MKPFLVRFLLAAGIAAIVSVASDSSPQDAPVYDKDIHYISYEGIEYPPLARQTRLQGVVVIRVKLDAQGKVTGASAISGHELLIQAAIANAKKWQFEPMPTAPQ